MNIKEKTPAKLVEIYERIFEEECKKATRQLNKTIQHPGKRVEIARKIAKRRADRRLEREHGTRIEEIRAKLAPDISIEELAV